MENVDVVKAFLRAQNLEQLGRVDEAIALYETAVDEEFDSTGPYDRLIGIYSHSARHADVVRVAERALEHVQTHEEKRGWYREMADHARRASASVPSATKKDVPPS